MNNIAGEFVWVNGSYTLQGTGTGKGKRWVLTIMLCSVHSTQVASDPVARWGGGKKHEIYVAAFGGHFFMTYLYIAWGAMAPSAPPPPGSATDRDRDRDREGQAQGTIVFYCAHPSPSPCPSPGPV